jgi:hypothetical protein
MKPEDSRFQDDYTTKLLELTAKTQNDFYSEVAEEVVKLRRSNEKLLAALTDLEDEVRILLRDNDLEVTEELSCAIDIARDAIAKAD